jgi:hypothetical protein
MTGPRDNLDQISDIGGSRYSRAATYLFISGDSRRSILAMDLPREPGQALSTVVIRTTRNERAQPETR